MTKMYHLLLAALAAVLLLASPADAALKRDRAELNCATCEALVNEIQVALEATNDQNQMLTGSLGRTKGYAKSVARKSDVIGGLCNHLVDYTRNEANTTHELNFERRSERKGENEALSKDTPEVYWACSSIMDEHEDDIEENLFDEDFIGELCDKYCPRPPRTPMRFLGKKPTEVVAGSKMSLTVAVVDPKDKKKVLTGDNPKINLVLLDENNEPLAADEHDFDTGIKRNAEVEMELGKAKFPSVKIGRTGSYVLRAYAKTGPYRNTSIPITVKLGEPYKLSFQTNFPEEVDVNEPVVPPAVVAMHDEGGNLVPVNGLHVNVSVCQQNKHDKCFYNNHVPIVDGLADLSDVRFNHSGRFEVHVNALKDGVSLAGQKDGEVVLNEGGEAGEGEEPETHKVIGREKSKRILATGPAKKPSYKKRPTHNVLVDQVLPAQPEVAIADDTNNVMHNFKSTIHLQVLEQRPRGQKVVEGDGFDEPVPAGSGVWSINAAESETFGGVAHFSGLVFHKPGRFTVRVTSPLFEDTKDEALVTVTRKASKLVCMQRGKLTYEAGKEFALSFQIQDEDGLHTREFDSEGKTVTLEELSGAEFEVENNELRPLSGSANFRKIKISTPGEYNFRATISTDELEPAESAVITITPGTASGIKVSEETSEWAVVLEPLARQPVVEIVDLAGNLVEVDDVVVALRAREEDPDVPEHAEAEEAYVETATWEAKTVAGRAVFDGVLFQSQGVHLLEASVAEEVNGVDVDTVAHYVTVTGTPTRLFFDDDAPRGAQAGQPVGKRLVVSYQDKEETAILEGTVQLSVASGPGSVTYDEASAVVEHGKARIGNVTLDKPGTYTIRATIGDLSADLEDFVVAGEPARVVMETHPSTTSTGGAVLAVQPVYTLRDADDNVVRLPKSQLPDTLKLVAVAGRGRKEDLELDFTATVETDGRLVFTDVALDKTGFYQLQARMGDLTPSEKSDEIMVTVGKAARLGFVDTPADIPGGEKLPQLTVVIQDAGGNTVPEPEDRAITIKKGSGPGIFTISVAKVKSSDGQSTFKGGKLDRAGTYTLEAFAKGLKSAVSSEINVVGPATKVVLVDEPLAYSYVGQPLSVQPTVALEDDAGNRMELRGVDVTVEKVQWRGTLAADATKVSTDEAGVAAFSGVTLGEDGIYQLKFFASGLIDVITRNITVTEAPSALAFDNELRAAVVGEKVDTDVVLTIKDDHERDVALDDVAITLSLVDADGKAIADGLAVAAEDEDEDEEKDEDAEAKDAENPLTASSSEGTVSFSNLVFNQRGVVQIAASASEPAIGGKSKSIRVTGPAVALEWVTPFPETVYQDEEIDVDVAVRAVDSDGTTVSSFTGRISLERPYGKGKMNQAKQHRAAEKGQAAFSGIVFTATGRHAVKVHSPDIDSFLNVEVNVLPPAKEDL